MSFTMVYYFVPEDGEDSNEFNAFGIDKDINSITQADIRSKFPLAGLYHFRFKNLIEGKVAWMDLNGDHCKALACQGKISVKVTRISWDDGKNESREVRKDRQKSFDLLND